MKRFMKSVRKPISVVLALCMFLSAVSVGLTVWAADTVTNQEEEAIVAGDDSFNQKQFNADLEAAVANSETLAETNEKGDAAGTNAGLVWIYNTMAQMITDNYEFIKTEFADRSKARTDKNRKMTDKTGTFLLNFLRLYAEAGKKLVAADQWTNSVKVVDAVALAVDNRLDDTAYPVLKWTDDKGVVQEGWTNKSNKAPITYLLTIMLNLTYKTSINYSNEDSAITITNGKVDEFLATADSIEELDDSFLAQVYAMWFQLYGELPDGSMDYYYATKTEDLPLNGKVPQPSVTVKTGADIKAALTAFTALFTSAQLAADKATIGAEKAKEIAEKGDKLISAITDLGMTDKGVSALLNKIDDKYSDTVLADAQKYVDDVQNDYTAAYDYETAVNAPYGKYIVDNEITELNKNQITELDPVIAGLKADYDSLTDAQKEYQFVKDAKTKTDMLIASYEASINKLYGDDYALYMKLLPQKLMTPEIKAAFTGVPMLTDAADQTKGIEAAMKDFVMIARALISMDPTKNTPELIGEAVKLDLMKAKELKTEEDKAFAAAVIDAFCGVTPAADSTAVVAAWQDDVGTAAEKGYYDVLIDNLENAQLTTEAGKSLTNAATVTWTFDADSVLAGRDSIVYNPEALESVKAAEDGLKNWGSLLAMANPIMSADLAAASFEDLLIFVADFESASDGLKYCSPKLQQALLSGASTKYASLTAAAERLAAVNAEIGNKFIAAVNEISEKYSEDFEWGWLTPETSAAFYQDYLKAMLIYDEIDETNLAREDVKAAKETLDTLYGTHSGYDIDIFLNEAKKLEQYQNKDGSANITADNRTAIRGIISRSLSFYSVLSDDLRLDENVVKYYALVNAFKDVIDATDTIPNWAEGTFDMSKYPNAADGGADKVIASLDGVLSSDAVVSLLGGLLSPDGEAPDSLGEILKGLIVDNLFNESIINTIVGFLFPEIQKAAGELSSIAALLKLYCTPYTWGGIFAPQLAEQGYTEVIKSFMDADGNPVGEDVTWDQIDTANISWAKTNEDGTVTQVSDYDSFVDALAAMLGGAWPVFKALLGNNNGLLSLAGIGKAPGYGDYVRPLLLQLGCKDVITRAEFEKPAVRDNSNAALRAILDPLMNRIVEIGEAPVTFITELLPTLAYMFEYNLITEGLNGLLAPINMDITTILPSNIKLNDLGSILGLVLGSLGLPPIELNTAYLATLATSTGVGSGYSAETTSALKNKCIKLDAKNDQVLVWLLEQVSNYINTQEFQDFVSALPSGSTESLVLFVVTLLNLLGPGSPNGLVDIILDMLQGGAEYTEYNWGALNHTDADITYPDGVTADDINNSIGLIDSMVSGALTNFTGKSLGTTISDALYTDATIGTVVKTLYAAGTEIDLPTILNWLGVDNSVDNVAAVLSDDYADASAAIKAAGEWANVDFAALNFNVSDKASFISAISAVTQPMNGILGILLNSDKGTVLNGLAINGSDGYSNAILPLLTAFGCTEKDGVLTNTAFKAAGNENIIKNILTPVLNLVDRVAADPVTTLAEILPNLAYFLNNKGLTKCVDSIIMPILNIPVVITDVVAMMGINVDILTILKPIIAGLLPEGFPLDLNDIDSSILPLINSLLASTGIVLPDIDWNLLAGCGEVKTRKLVTLQNDDYNNFANNYVQANTAESTVTVLRYVLDAVKANADVIKGLLGDNAQILSIVDKLLSNSNDDIIKAIVGVLNADGSTEFNWGSMIFNASSVALPSGISTSQVNKTIANADKTIAAALSAFAGTSLDGFVSGAVYTDANVTAVVKALYTALGSADLAPVLSALGIDLSTSNVAALIADVYPEIASAIAAAGDWSAVDFDSFNWRATNKDSFAKAVAVALRPLSSVLRTFLAGDSMNILGAYPLKGAEGYKNAVLPILTALGCNAGDGVLSSGAYVRAANQNGDNLILNIVKPALNLVERLAKAPVSTLTEMAPNFAYFINNDGLKKAIDALLLPITNVADPIIGLITDQSVLDFVLGLLNLDLPIDINNIKGSIVPLINSLLAGLEIGGKKLGLQIPDIDWAYLAGCGTQQSKSLANMNTPGYTNFANTYVQANKADAGVAILRYVAKTLSYGSNPAAIKGLVGADGMIGDIVNNLTTAKPDAIVKMIVQLFAPDNSGLVASWTFKKIKSLETTYTPNLGREDFEQAITAFDDLIPDLLKDLAGIDSLQSLLTDNLYTPSTMASIFKAITSALSAKSLGFDLFGTLDTVGIHMTPAGVANALTEKQYASLRKTLAAAGNDWSKVNFDKVNWGFSKGSESGFINTLTAMLRPLSGVLGAVLAGKDLVLLDGITIKGANGYSNAIVPLLEALGCSNIMSVSAYNKSVAKNGDNAILSITKPLLSRVNELLAKPVSVLSELLPNIAYFMENNGLSQLVNAAILPITKVLKTVNPAIKINLDLSAISNLDVVDLVNGLLKDIKIEGKSLNIRLLDFDWADLAGVGKLENFRSQRVDANGKRVMAKRVAADQPAVLLTVLRYVIANLQDAKNLASIQELISGLDLGDIADVINEVLNMLATEDGDAVIEFLLQLLFNIGVTPEEDVPVKENTKDKPSSGNTITPDKGVNVPLIVGLSVGGLLLLALAIWLIVKKKKSAQ